MGQHPVHAGQGRRTGHRPPGGALAGMLLAAVQPVGHHDQPRRRKPPGGDRAQRKLGADVVAGDQRTRPHGLAAEPRHHLGQPVGRVGVAWAVLGVAVQRQIGQHHPEPRRQRRHDRLPLAVRQPQRVQQRQPGPGPGLAIRDPRPVVVVIEPQPHCKPSTERRCTTPSAIPLVQRGCANAARPSRTLPKRFNLIHMEARSSSPLGLSTSQAAKALGVSLGTIRRWSDMGYLQSYRTPGGQRRFSADQIEQFLVTLRRGGDPSENRERLVS